MNYSKKQVLCNLERDIARDKKNIEAVASEYAISKKLSQNLTSYELVANSKQRNYPVLNSADIHRYLLDIDLKRPTKAGEYYNVISFYE